MDKEVELLAKKVITVKKNDKQNYWKYNYILSSGKTV